MFIKLTGKQYEGALTISKGNYAEAGRILDVSRQAVHQHVAKRPQVKELCNLLKKGGRDNNDSQGAN
jgi:hypothetical protein